MKKRIISAILLIAICLSTVSGLVSCKKNGDGKKEIKDTLVLMTENLDGLFNPFFSTSATDSTIVSMTQIGMLSSKLNDKNEVEVAFGQNEPTATLDFESKKNDSNETVYTFVLKNGIKYADGHPLTMEDVLFNLYVYLDPVYTGSATIYSTDIKGLASYRYQQPGLSAGDNGNEDDINKLASEYAQNRILSLLQLYWAKGDELNGGPTTSPQVPYQQMVAAIKAYDIQSDVAYLNAVAAPDKQSLVTYQNLLDDYELALKYFKEELESDFKNAKDSYTEEPYKSHPEFQDEVFCFMFTEGFIEPVYAKLPGTNKDDKSKIESFRYNYDNDAIKTKDAAIQKVYDDTVTGGLDTILTLWATATKLTTEFTAKAKEVILEGQKEDGKLIVPNIEGIVSLGHTTNTETVTVNGNTYTVAHDHNTDGTPKNANEYDVLQITVNGVDPKAVWNFAFSVAPQHYYGEDGPAVNIANNEFGVVWSSFDFMRTVLQSPRNNKLPMGAGAYKVTNRNNEDAPSTNDFFSNNIVYFKANDNFQTVGTGLNNANIKKVRYQVVSASNAIAALQEGSVDYITPQYSKENYTKINELKKSNYDALLTDQLGYGYIGINAEKVNDINLRRAIMAAMNTSLAIDYYAAGTASQIYWPMSKVSWAHPLMDDGKTSEPNGKNYIQSGIFNETQAKETILSYMAEAGVSEGHPDLKLKFTIAGSNLQDHPTYKVFRDAAKLLNELGWDITVEPDTQALTKLATGSLTVWAAAWGSALDPDMYQVYHKNSTATSTLAWGYRYLNSSGASAEEKQILDDLSLKIEEARETDDRTVRSALYKEAMSYVLDLAVELPVYQRSTVYVYNTDVIDSTSVPSVVNPYSSPLDRIWELKLVAQTGTGDGGDGLGIGAIIGIIAGGVALLGGGGFCLWYFVIRKKLAAPKTVIEGETVSEDEIDELDASADAVSEPAPADEIQDSVDADAVSEPAPADEIKDSSDADVETSSEDETE